MKEPVNKPFILDYVTKNFQALQKLEVRGLPASTILLSYAMRADKKGYVRTAWKPSLSPCGLRTRFYSGLSVFKCADPMLQALANNYLQFEQVPLALRGLSAFCLPKELRHLVRMNCGLTDLDQKAAHPNIQLSRIQSKPGQYPAVPLLEEYLQDPVAFRQETGAEKDLLLSFFYGKRCPDNCHPKVRAFFEERLAIIDVDADLFKDIFPTNGNFKLKKTLQFYLNQHGEQERQDMLYEAIVAAGGNPVSVEHDGVVFEHSANIDALKAKLLFEVSVKPQLTEEELSAACKTRWHDLPWDSGSELCAEREQARLRCEYLLDSGDTGRHESFGRYIALTYKNVVAVSETRKDSFTWFDPATCIWQEYNQTKLTKLVTDAFHDLRGMHSETTNKHGADMTTIVLSDYPAKLEDNAMKNAALTASKPFLLRSLPPSDNAEGTLLFKCGTCLNFRTGRLFRPGSDTHYTRHCAVEYVPFPQCAETDEWLAIVEELKRFWAVHDHLEKHGDGVNELGRPDLCERLRKLILGTNIFPWVKATYQLYDDWDRCLYILKWVVRIAAGIRKFNEALFPWGLGWSGKDTIVNSLTGLLGYDTDNGYVGTLKPEYFDENRSSSAEGATAFLSALDGARLCVISERKQAQSFDGEKLKPLTEQEGCRIPARKLFKDPVAFTMTAAFIGLSNNQMDLGPNPDDGLRRRVVPDPMPNKFVPAEKMVEGCPSHWRAMDETIKTRARKGEFASEMVFVMQSLFDTLFLREGTNIKPVPLRIQEEQKEIFGAGSQGGMKKWLHDNCIAVDNASDASHRNDVHKRLGDDVTLGIGHKRGAAWKALLEVGVSYGSDGRGLNCYKFKFDDKDQVKPFKLKEIPAS